jgi:hypothetical protein
MRRRPDKPREYFLKLLDTPEEKIDYSEIGQPTGADWEDAEVLLPDGQAGRRPLKCRVADSNI